MPKLSKHLRLLASLISCLFIFSTIACKKKTTTRSVNNNTQLPGTGNGTGSSNSSCAYALGEVNPTPVDPNKLEVASLEIKALANTYQISVTEPGPPKPASHRIAYEVCPQSGEGCQLYSIISLTDYNPNLKPGTSKITAWGCCNHSDGLCTASSQVPKMLGPEGSKKQYYCGKPLPIGENGFATVPTLTGVSNADSQQNLYLAELDKRTERAATEAFGLIKQKAGSGSTSANLQLTNNNSGQVYYKAIASGGFDQFLRMVETVGVDVAEGIAVTPGKGASLTEGLSLTNDDCLPDSGTPDIYPPLDNPYDSDPVDFTPPSSTGDDEEDNEDNEEENDEIEENLSLKALCEERGRQYESREVGTTEWRSETNECWAIATNGEEQLIDPTEELPEQTVASTAQEGEKQANGWKTAGGWFIGLGAVAAVGGITLYVEGTNSKSRTLEKINADITRIDERIGKLSFVKDGELDDEAFKSASDKDKKRYHELQTRKQRLNIEAGLTSHRDALLDFNNLNSEFEQAKAAEKANPSSSEAKAKVASTESALNEFKGKNGVSDLSAEDAIKKLNNRVIVFEDLRGATYLRKEVIDQKSANLDAAFNTTDKKATFGTLSLTKTEFTELFEDSVKPLKPEGVTSEVTAIKNNRIEVGDPNFTSKIEQTWSNYRSPQYNTRKVEFGKTAAKYGIGALVVGIIAQQVFSLSQDPKSKRLSDLEHYLVKTRLRYDACLENAKNCHD